MTKAENDIGDALAEICEAAAQLILPLWRSGLTVIKKADHSPVTEADQRAEVLILKHLAERFPGVPVISEEDASEFGTPDAIGPRFFLVDPLDGTKAFVRGDPNFTVNIGLIEDGRPVAGAVAAPSTEETWFTSARQDPEARERRLRPAGPRSPMAGRSGAGPCQPYSYGRSDSEAVRPVCLRPSPADRFSIKLCRIAEGTADIYPRHGPTMEWDVAAAQAVLEAAGGRMATLQGQPFRYGKAAEGFRNGWFVARGA